MKHLIGGLALISWAALFGCSAENSPADAGQKQDGSLADASSDPCANADGPVFGARFDPAQNCINPEQVAQVACSPAEPQSDGAGYYCFKRKSDGEIYWTIQNSRVDFNQAEWELCHEGVEELPPRACFTKACEQAPVSLCSQEHTTAMYGCGGADSEWDANCCARQDCTTAADCSADEECVEVSTRTYQDCWPTSASGDCDCAGTAGGPSRFVCVAKE